MEFSFQDAKLIARDTPWDQKVLQCISNEIIDFSGTNLQSLEHVLNEFEVYCKTQNIQFTNIRISAQEMLQKKMLQQFGFQFIESSVEVIRNNAVFEIDEFQLKLKSKIKVVDYTEAHLNDLLQIAEQSFNYGRFAEDPDIERTINEKRNSNWLKVLVSSNTVKVLLYNEAPAGFMAYVIKEHSCQLILGGVKDERQYLAPLFWYEVLNDIQQYTTTKTYSTVISAANIGVFNLYIKLGFKTAKTYWGFSKHRKFI